MAPPGDSLAIVQVQYLNGCVEMLVRLAPTNFVLGGYLTAIREASVYTLYEKVLTFRLLLARFLLQV